MIRLQSGEALPLLVPLAELNVSAHQFNTEAPVFCTDCHSGKARYQYPHQPNPAQTRRDFTRSVSENCQDCHYPHNPLHAGDPSNPDRPTCADCHGSHQIDQMENIADKMPTACVACHTGQTPEWAAEFIAPRPGLGEAAEGYAGSHRCAGCHEETYFSWRETLHARMIQDPVANPSVVAGDFSQTDPDLTFALDDVVYTIGSRWKQRYLTRDEKGDFYILPAQWNVETGEWVAYKPDAWPENEWRQSCGSCHVTGLGTQTWGFAEPGIGCESCHGPGAEHAAGPDKVKPFAEVDDQVCGACHSRGASPDGLAFPATYRPGDALAGHFTFATGDSDIWPGGSAKKHRQQYMDWQLGSSMALSVDTNCVTCHTKFGEDPQWAVDIIAYVAQIATPGPEAVFSPGPTPTSPPPPTPLPSVGQPSTEQVYIETGRWLRVTAFIILGLIVVGSIYLVYRSMTLKLTCPPTLSSKTRRVSKRLTA